MRPRIAVLLFLTFLSSSSFASGFLLFQHGGRATAQAGAFAARAADPTAVRYNPAAIARLDGLQFQAGLDFQAPTDEFESPGRTDSPEHVIQFPPALYFTWKPDDLAVPLAFGISIDSPFWSIQNWNPALFPGRFDTLRQELTLFEIRPTIAWAMSERWSLGAALRYAQGDLETSWAHLETFAAGPGSETNEVTTEVATDADGLGFDLALHYDVAEWGFGLVASSGISLDGDGDVSSHVRDPFFDPRADARFQLLYPSGSGSADFELPPTLTAGLWVAFAENVTFEVDLAWSRWSELDETSIGIGPSRPGGLPPSIVRRRDWQDVIGARTGLEIGFAGGWAIGAGLAWEPSPVPDSTIEPGFPRGDAFVAALGGSYNMESISFDVGYSYYFYEDRDATLHTEPPANGTVAGTFSARSQIFAFSVRWRR
jgi:long-chain fatty acid transport protein